MHDEGDCAIPTSLGRGSDRPFQKGLNPPRSSLRRHGEFSMSDRPEPQTSPSMGSSAEVSVKIRSARSLSRSASYAVAPEDAADQPMRSGRQTSPGRETAAVADRGNSSSLPSEASRKRPQPPHPIRFDLAEGETGRLDFKAKIDEPLESMARTSRSQPALSASLLSART